MATVVSAFIPLTSSKYPITHYFLWVRNFLEHIPCNLVFFTDATLIPTFSEWRGKYMDRTVFVAFDFEKESEALKKWGVDFWKRQLELDEEYTHIHGIKDEKTNNTHLYTIWYEKKEFVLRALKLNPFNHNKFMWADAGGFRIHEWIPKLDRFPLAEKIPDDKFFLLNLDPFQEDELANFLTDFSTKTRENINKSRIGGGYLAATKEKWIEFSRRYDEIVDIYKKIDRFTGVDQHIMSAMYIREPGFFQLVKTNESCGNAWLWPQLYFSI